MAGLTGISALWICSHQCDLVVKRTMGYSKVSRCKYSCMGTLTMAPIIMFHFQATWKVRFFTQISCYNSIMEESWE